MKKILLICLALATASLSAEDVSALMSTFPEKGLCVVRGNSVLAKDIQAKTALHVMLLIDGNDVEKHRQDFQDDPAFNNNIYVLAASPSEIPFANHAIDVYISDTSWNEAEVTTKLSQRGIALLVEKPLSQTVIKKLTKEDLSRFDDWTHWYHGPDNNPVSTDTELKWPYLTQYLSEPYIGAQPRTTVIAAGRLFTATGESGGEPTDPPDRFNNTHLLEALSLHNGLRLWQRKLDKDYYVGRGGFVATADAFYMINDTGPGVLELDPESGQERRILAAEHGYGKWIGVVEGELYILSGAKDPGPHTYTYKLLPKYPAPPIAPYPKPERWWGAGALLSAVDLAAGTETWQHTAIGSVDGRLLAVHGQHLYYCAPDAGVLALDRQTGAVAWSNTSPELLELTTSLNASKLKKKFGNSLGTTRPGLTATPELIIVRNFTMGAVIGLKVNDGSILWSAPLKGKKDNYIHPFWMDGGLHSTKGVLDWKTGTLGSDRDENSSHSASGCGPVNVTPDGFYGRHSCFYLRSAGRKVEDHFSRSGCWQDALPAGGLLFSTPYSCACNYSLQGFVAKGSAGDFEFNRTATESERLHQTGHSASGPAATAADWPMHRGDITRSSSAPVDVSTTVTAARWSFTPPRAGLAVPAITANGMIWYATEDGTVYGLQEASGEKVWSFPTGGKIYAALTYWQGRIYLGSSDGHAYCLDAQNGKEIWRFRAAPINRYMLVYGRFSSTWPVNSGVLIHEGKAFFACGVTPQDGSHLYAVDAETGALLLQNNTSGHMHEDFKAGMSPHGSMTIKDGFLWLCGGCAASPVAYHLNDLSVVKPDYLAQQASAKWQHIRGREIGVIGDYLVQGGPMMYGPQPGRSLKAGCTYTFMTHDKGKVLYPQVEPAFTSYVAPAWDDTLYCTPLEGFKKLEAWPMDKLLAHIQTGVATAPNERDLKLKKKPVFKFFNRRGKIEKAFHEPIWDSAKLEMYGIVVCKNMVLVACGYRPHAKKPFHEWSLVAFSRTDGKELWKAPLSAEPILSPLSVTAQGSVLVALKNGVLQCY